MKPKWDYDDSCAPEGLTGGQGHGPDEVARSAAAVAWGVGLILLALAALVVKAVL